MYEEPEASTNLPELERRTLEYWKANGIFGKTLARSSREAVFYDGPPFPTGIPHHGTIFVSVLKDAFARFYTMRGYSVPRTWGWDCHGLPIETAVEKQFGVTEKRQIEREIGVAAFNAACRKLVDTHNDSWERYIDRIGRWVEYEHPYRTCDAEYMESVIWVFAECYRKGLVYRDYRVTPYCYRCETSLSISDTRESDSTRPRTDTAAVVKFRLHEPVGEKPAYLLAWTTTPWTLPSNLALAVNASMRYAVVDCGSEALILSEENLGRYAHVLPENASVASYVTGRDLTGVTYDPPFPYFPGRAGAFRVLSAAFVVPGEGVGTVHVAPAFGEDDYWLCRDNGITLVNPVDCSGRFTDAVPDFEGLNVHAANDGILSRLEETGALLAREEVTHNYPHCWRCGTPLIYRAMDAWYFAVEKIKGRLVELNDGIGWIPETVKHGRFGNWLSGARDWNISRNRYWGTPMPVWECGSCGDRWIPSSRKEIEDAWGRSVPDLHKEYLDAVTVPCPCGGTMARIPEVLDCWFESGAMPFGQCHYPFERREWFESRFPADFIIEYTGQIRCWFYYLHVLAVALMDRPAFRHCLVHGTLLSEDGDKFSKSKRNYTDPMRLLDTYGADPLRLYLLGSQAAVMADLKFRDEDISIMTREILLPLINSCRFFTTYAGIDGYRGNPAAVPQGGRPLDRWILASLRETGERVLTAFERFRTNDALPVLSRFLDDLSNWYIRRSRSRFWSKGLSDGKRASYDVLYYALVTFLKFLAPSAPFLTEHLYRGLTGEESVHLADWPIVPDTFGDPGTLRTMEKVRKIAALGLSLRRQSGIRARQPLGKLSVVLPENLEAASLSPYLCEIEEEVNVGRIEFLENAGEIAVMRAVPDPRKLGPRYGKEVQEIIRFAKEGSVTVGDETAVVYGNGKSWEIPLSEIAVGYRGRDGRAVAHDGGIVAGIDLTLTPELLKKGLENDLNRLIQTMRKDAGYRVSDRIRIEIDGPLDEDSAERLATAALAERTAIERPELVRETALHGATYAIRIAKA